MDTGVTALLAAHQFTNVDTRTNALQLFPREVAPAPDRPPVFKAVGISLAIASGVFIGTSFVLKKTGLLKANVKYNEEAGEGYGYLKNAFWWTGMTLMIIGEICNFIAYAFVDAILVTPLGALSVVITTILSAIFLKERLSFVGKIGCFLCIIGSVIILLSAPSQSSAGTIQQMQHFVLAPGFLSYAGVIIVGCAFIAFWVGPRYGKKSMLVYLSICSLIGGLSVVATQGLGAAIVTQIGGTKQYNQPFLYILFVFVIATLVTEIIFLNKALNIFNAALVTPTYYVFFTSATLVTSAILFQGFKGSVTSIITIVLGFLVICCGVILLQLSKSAKDVPDTEVFKGDLNQVRTVAEQEQPESEPKADAIRGTAAIIRRLSNARQKNEAQEARRVQEDRLKDQMEPIGEDEQVQWDGLRRRKTTLSLPPQGLQRRKTLHPPLGMARFPEEEERQEGGTDGQDDERGGAFDGGFMSSEKLRCSHARCEKSNAPCRLNRDLPARLQRRRDTPYGAVPRSREKSPNMAHVYGLPPGLERQGGDGAVVDGRSKSRGKKSKPLVWADDTRMATPASQQSLAPTPPPHTARRQFSFQNVFHRHRGDEEPEKAQAPRPTSRKGLSSRASHKDSLGGHKSPTEEERMGLVQGDSSANPPLPEYTSEDEDWRLEGGRQSDSPQKGSPLRGEKEVEDYETQRQQWANRQDPHAPRPPSRDRDVEKEEAERNYRKDHDRPGGGGGGTGAFI
ncbi:hypothetical protein G7Y79_00025g057530 [Physcia stellaris]|nr:hypothetical protein G7Y79_00025g057530 [Physcia stellaris]